MHGPEGAPVVLLAHGLMTSHRMWDGVARVLGAEWRLLGYDLRGHGETSATPGPYSIAQLAADAIGLLDALEIREAHFIGLSLGGMIGQSLGAHHPDRCTTLTLANTTCEQAAAADWQQRIDKASTEGVQALVEGTLQRWFTPAAFAGHPALVAETAATARATSLAGFLGCAAAVRDLSQRELLGRIERPTLVVGGDQDQATTPAEARVLAERIRGAQLCMLPAAHQSAIECPAAFAAAWAGFQSKTARSSP